MSMDEAPYELQIFDDGLWVVLETADTVEALKARRDFHYRPRLGGSYTITR